MMWGIPVDVQLVGVAVAAVFAVGVVFTNRVFMWSFLLTNAMLRPVGQVADAPMIVLSLWTAGSADWAAKRHTHGHDLA